MATLTTVQSRGQVTVSADVRKAAGARAGDTVEFTRTSSDSARLHVDRRLMLDDFLRWWRVNEPVDMQALREAAYDDAAREAMGELSAEDCSDQKATDCESDNVTAHAKIQARGQITIPYEIRRAIGSEPGATVLLRATGPATIDMRVIPKLNIDELHERYPIAGPIDDAADREAWQEEAAKDVIGSR